MKMLKVATMLLACTEGSQMYADSDAHLHTHTYINANVLKSFEIESREQRLSQSFAEAFNMAPPKLMITGSLPGAGKGECPSPGKKLTHDGTGGAFLDGCYMNTTRKMQRNEETGEMAQHYKYMWKNACAFTKWVPSNQFMYSNLEYDAQTMTLERFGFIGMDKRCYWGSIGILWKRPLAVDQILPNNTLKIEGPQILQQGQLVNSKSTDGLCLIRDNNEIVIGDCASDNSDDWQHWDNGEIRFKETNKCLSVSDSENWTPILLDECNGSESQRWDLKPTTDKLFQIVSKKYDKCLNVKGQKTAEKGLKANIFECFSDDNMEYFWKIAQKNVHP